MIGRGAGHGWRRLACAACGVVPPWALVAMLVGVAPAAAQPAPRHRPAALTRATRQAAAARPPASHPLAACVRALTRTGGPVLYRTADGELERELPAACGGGYERRSRAHDLCRDGCFVRTADRSLAVVGRFREGNLIVVLGRTGRRFAVQAALRTDADEAQLLDDAGALRVRRSFASVHGVAASQPALLPGERVAFHVLAWRFDKSGWRSELSVALRSKSALRLVPVAVVAAPDSQLRAVSRVPAPAAAAAR